VSSSPSRILVGAHNVDLRERSVTHDGVAARLSWRHFEALALLIESDRQIVSKEQFFARLWPGQEVVDESNLTQCISQLRKALANGNGDPGYIETVPRMGYRLVAPIRRIGIEAAPAAAPDQATAAIPESSEPPRVVRWLTIPRLVLGAGLIALLASAVGWSWVLCCAGAPPSSSEARERGATLLRHGDAAGAVAELQHATRLNPSDARAYSALAHALHRQSAFDSVSRPVGQSPSVEAARRAVALDASCGGCHGTLGLYLFYHDWQWAEAERHLREAIRLEPDTEAIRPSFALLLTATGRLAEALAEIDVALAKRPYEMGWQSIRASILYAMGRYGDALAASDTVLKTNDRERTGWEWRSKVLFQLGRGPEAIKALAQQAFAAHSAKLDEAVRAGGTVGGLRTLLEVTGDWRLSHEQAWRRGPWRALLGDVDGALDELERAHAMRNVNLMYIAVDPVFAPLRSHPRFQRLVSEMGLDTVTQATR
jgi:DNA-binding winged helix-turn-helix (wHTH) protein/Tfp pilus assembly protein PilF